MNFVLIDGSYYIFYRYYALCVWYKLRKKPEDPDIPFESEMFMEKFRDTFVSKIAEMDSMLGIDQSVKYVGKDCPKHTIWRNAHIENYKGGRGGDDISSLFKVAYSEGLFAKADCKGVLEYPTLEADDCIALAAQHIRQKYPDAKVWIITSDMDYLQIACDPWITLVDLKYKNLTTSKTSFQDAKKDLFCKIVAGDKSDNIPSVLPRCGIKTAAKYYENRDLFERKLKECDGAAERLERNTTIVDFACIPDELKTGFNAIVADTIVADAIVADLL
jgi:5'-3' exonuclease